MINNKNIYNPPSNEEFKEFIEECEKELKKKTVNQMLEELEEEISGVSETLDEIPSDIVKKWVLDIKKIREREVEELGQKLSNMGVTFGEVPSGMDIDGDIIDPFAKRTTGYLGLRTMPGEPFEDNKYFAKQKTSEIYNKEKIYENDIYKKENTINSYKWLFKNDKYINKDLNILKKAENILKNES